MKILLLIDANALIHRFFHALPPFTSPDGRPTGALYGLASVLLKILREQKPDYIAAAFDRPAPTFRKEAFEEYKKHRPPTATELIAQMQEAHTLFAMFHIKTFEMPGFEADDLIGTLAERYKNDPLLAGGRVVVLSGDRDLLQLVDDDKVVAELIKTGASETVPYNERAVQEYYGGLSPRQLPDYKGLVGDPSDNIPGVEGVGPKTATELLKEFSSVEEVYENLMIITPKTAKKLEGKKDIALLSKKLATIRLDTPIELNGLATLKAEPPDAKTLTDYFEKLGFKSLIERLGR